MMNENIKYYRNRKNISRYRLSKLTGINDGLLSKIENNQIKDPRISTIIKISKALEITVDQLINETEKGKRGERFMCTGQTIVYNYLFNYFGMDKYKDKTICGAGIDIAIIPVKNGNEVGFSEENEPQAYDRDLSEVFKVSFDKNKMFTIKRNLRLDNLFRIFYGWDKISYEIVGYTLDYFDDVEETKKIIKDLRGLLADERPNEILNLPCCVSMDITEEEFVAFLRSHIEDFDILDNKNAQVPSVTFIER